MFCQGAKEISQDASPPDAEAVRAQELALLAACPAEERAAFARFLQMVPSLPHGAQMAQFQAAVDASDFSLADWAAAAAVFQEWLEAGNRTARFARKLGYLTCCAESLGAVAPALRPTLAEQVRTMLADYGFGG